MCIYSKEMGRMARKLCKQIWISEMERAYKTHYTVRIFKRSAA